MPFVYAYIQCLDGPGNWFSLTFCVLIQVFLAHLSRRLIGELIVYQWSGVSRRRPPSSVNIFKHLFPKTAWPIKAKCYVEPPWVGRTKGCSRHLGHMTKMAATPIYGKNPSKILSRTVGPLFTNLVCSIRDSSPS